jgi:hypothetical protein
MGCILHARVRLVSFVSGAVWWNTQLGERFLCVDELTLIHPTTSFYASLQQKRLYVTCSRILYVRLAGTLGGPPHARASATWMDEWVTFLFLKKVGWAGWLGLSITIGNPGLPIFRSSIYLLVCIYIHTQTNMPVCYNGGLLHGHLDHVWLEDYFNDTSCIRIHFGIRIVLCLVA